MTLTHLQSPARKQPTNQQVVAPSWSCPGRPTSPARRAAFMAPPLQRARRWPMGGGRPHSSSAGRRLSTGRRARRWRAAEGMGLGRAVGAHLIERQCSGQKGQSVARMVGRWANHRLIGPFHRTTDSRSDMAKMKRRRGFLEVCLGYNS